MHKRKGWLRGFCLVLAAVMLLMDIPNIGYLSKVMANPAADEITTVDEEKNEEKEKNQEKKTQDSAGTDADLAEEVQADKGEVAEKEIEEPAQEPVVDVTEAAEEAAEDSNPYETPPMEIQVPDYQKYELPEFLRVPSHNTCSTKRAEEILNLVEQDSICEREYQTARNGAMQSIKTDFEEKKIS